VQNALASNDLPHVWWVFLRLAAMAAMLLEIINNQKKTPSG
jgi:hypothetical protein